MKNLRICLNQILSVTLFTSLAMLSFQQAKSQATVDNNVPTIGAYLGWNDAQDLDFRTNNILRMQLMETQTSTINGFAGIAQGGFLGLSTDLNLFNGTGPYSMIHLSGSNFGNPQQNGFRPWMKYGMTVTSNRDLMYVGQKADSLDKTDAVIAWSDNGSGSQFGPDNLRFIFTGETNYGGSSTSHTLGGQEIMRLTAAPEARVAIGNYSANGLNDNPTERLDVDGTARLRQMPNESPDVLITGLEENQQGDYTLNYLGFSGNSTEFLAGDGTWLEIENNTEDCDWEIFENEPGILDVVSGHGNDCYPAGHVGIGVTEPQAKLDVYHGDNQVNAKNTTIRARWEESASDEPFGNVYGVHSYVRRLPTILTGTAVYGEAVLARFNYGGDFQARANTLGAGTTAVNCGVRGQAFGFQESGVNLSFGGDFAASVANSNPSQSVFGVRARASGGDRAYGVFGSANGAATENWAGYFVGDTYCTAGVWTSSDETLKLNIQPLESAMEILQQIEPKEYSFLTEQYSQMHLPTGQQQGVIAQELEQVLPNLVKSTTHPAQYDTLGNEISAAVEFKSVNYMGLIPYLIAGVKEQQAQIEAQEGVIAGLQESLANQNELITQMMDQMQQLQNMVSSCCGLDAVPKNSGGQGNVSPANKVFGSNELYQNIPNPFRSETTIRYTLEQGGHAMLNIHDHNGRQIAQLENAEQTAGSYQYIWDASGLPAGTYHYSLIVDGELLVKRAIKLQD